LYTGIRMDSFTAFKPASYQAIKTSAARLVC
jgi:hypothetical protein